MNLFTRVNKVKKLEEEIQRITSSKSTAILTQHNTVNVDIYYTDYLYPRLKESLTHVMEVIETLKIKNVTVKIFLKDTGILVIKAGVDEPEVVVDLLEVLKSRVPSARNVKITGSEISFRIEDYELGPKVALDVATMLVQHFSEDLPNGSTIVINLGDKFSVKYDFKWLKTNIVNETVVNSNRYNEMIQFLAENPHPGVKTFIFQFRDSNKGLYSGLNVVPVEGTAPDDLLTIVEFIREKLNSKFPNLPLF